MLNKELKKISGSVLGIGLNEKEINLLEENNNIFQCYLLNSNHFSSGNKKGHSKVINIRKIKKQFHKKSFDYIVGNFKELEPYLRTFIKDSIYLNKSKLYFYNLTDFEIDELEKRYVRYNSKFEKTKDLIIIDNSNSKTNVFKNIYYYICDLIYDIIEYISKILVN